jgi:hypothetical protein
VNREIKAYNKKVTKIIGAYNHTKIIEFNDDRKLYTNQGFHFNKFDKIVISKQMVGTILSLQQLMSKVPISTNWYINPSGVNNLETFKCIANHQPSTQKLDVTGQCESEHDHEGDM